MGRFSLVGGDAESCAIIYSECGDAASGAARAWQFWANAGHERIPPLRRGWPAKRAGKGHAHPERCGRTPPGGRRKVYADCVNPASPAPRPQCPSGVSPVRGGAASPLIRWAECGIRSPKKIFHLPSSQVRVLVATALIQRKQSLPGCARRILHLLVPRRGRIRFNKGFRQRLSLARMAPRGRRPPHRTGTISLFRRFCIIRATRSRI